MTTGKGFLGAAAHDIGSTWNTPVAAADAIQFESESFTSSTAIIPDRTLGKATMLQGDAGERAFGGDMTIPLRYEGHEAVIMALCMGTAGAPSTVDTSARKHVIRPADTVEGKFGTLAFEKLVQVHEFKSVKWTGWSLEVSKGADRNWARFKPRGTASDLDIASSTNTTATIAAATAPTPRTFAQFNQMVVRVNAQSAGALGSSDNVYVAGVTLDFDRPSMTDDYTTNLGNKIDEPTQNEFAVVKVTLQLSKFMDGTGGNATLRAAADTKAAQKMSITFTGLTLAGASTQFFQWIFYLNAVQFEPVLPNISGPGVLAYQLVGEAHRVTSIPTGWPTGYLEPLVIENYSTRTTDLLA